MFDAISTKDYYALAGYLQSSRRQEAFLDPHNKIKLALNEADAVRKKIEDSSLTKFKDCLLYTSPSPRDQRGSRMPSSA